MKFITATPPDTTLVERVKKEAKDHGVFIINHKADCRFNAPALEHEETARAPPARPERVNGTPTLEHHLASEDEPETRDKNDKQPLTLMGHDKHYLGSGPSSGACPGCGEKAHAIQAHDATTKYTTNLPSDNSAPSYSRGTVTSPDQDTPQFLYDSASFQRDQQTGLMTLRDSASEYQLHGAKREKHGYRAAA